MFRLDALERFALEQVFPLIPAAASSWLFGSRTDLNARGGDIDILIQYDAPENERFDLSRMLTLVFQRHCEEKIDFVVFPLHDLSIEQRVFLDSLNRLELSRVVFAPHLDHVAILTSDLKATHELASAWGFPLQAMEVFESEGTTEFYVGESGRSARVLFVQATGPGPYLKALKKRGPGLHHLGLRVCSMKYFLTHLRGSGWMIHPASFKEGTLAPTVYVARAGLPLLLEVFERTSKLPPALAPVVEKVRVSVSERLSRCVSTLDCPQLEWASDGLDTAIKIGQRWLSTTEL